MPMLVLALTLTATALYVVASAWGFWPMIGLLVIGNLLNLKGTKTSERLTRYYAVAVINLSFLKLIGVL